MVKTWLKTEELEKKMKMEKQGRTKLNDIEKFIMFQKMLKTQCSYESEIMCGIISISYAL